MCPLYEKSLREGQLQIMLNLGMTGKKKQDTFPKVRLLKQFINVDV